MQLPELEPEEYQYLVAAIAFADSFLANNVEALNDQIIPGLWASYTNLGHHEYSQLMRKLLPN